MKNTYRTWFVRFYNNANIDLKSFFETNTTNYAYILHDKDIYLDDGENHVVGEIKKPHYHACICFENAKSLKAVTKLFCNHIPNCGIYATPTKKNIGNAYIYLTHSDDLHKYQYESSAIVSNNNSYFLSAESLAIVEADNTDWTIELFHILIDNDGTIPTELFLSYAKRYGRDFIFNMSRVLNTFEIFQKNLK